MVIAEPPLRRNRDYSLLWVGQSLSQIGSNASQLAYPLLALSLTGSPARAGVVGAANWLPYVLFQLVAGALVDRWNRRATMLVSTGLNALAVASIAVAYALDALSFWQLVAVAFVDRTLSTFFSPAEASALTRVVPAERLAEAVGRNDAREHVASLAGPPLGGALFGVAPYAPFIADAASYAISFATIAALRTPLAAPPVERHHLRAEVLDGLRFVWRVPFLRASILQATGTNLTWSGMTLTMIFVARGHGASGGEVGAMFALLGAGGILGSVASRRLLARFSLPAIVLATIWIWTLLIALLLATTNAFALGAIAGAAMFFTPTWNGAIVGKTMALTPDHLRGRVSAADALLSFGLRPLAFVGVGWLDQAHGGRATFAALAVYTLGIAVLSTLSPSLRTEPV